MSDHPLNGLSTFRRQIYDATGIDGRTVRQVAEKAGFYNGDQRANVSHALSHLKKVGLVHSDETGTTWWRSAL